MLFQRIRPPRVSAKRPRLNRSPNYRRSPRVSGRRRRLTAETLETRINFSVSIAIDYSLDTQGFFGNTSARDALEDVAADISSRLNDSFNAITPSGSNSWDLRFFHPATGAYGAHVVNPTIAADEYRIYAGGRELGGNTLGSAGPGGFSAGGNQAWFDAIRQRGQTGVATDTDFAAWGGSVAFDSVGTTWHYDETTTGLVGGESDFRSVAYHELIHALGFGSADSFDAWISGGQFTGPAALGEYDFGGNVPLYSDLSHFADGTTDGGQETAMDPIITSGTRKFPTPLDWAVMTDIGWEVTANQVYVAGNDLIVDGTEDANVITVSQVAAGLQIVIDGQDQGIWALPVGEIIVNALGGNDDVTFQSSVTADARLFGGAGNDLLRTGAGNDFLFGGDGNDSLYGRDGVDELFGEAGADRVFGMDDADFLYGGDQNDTLSGGAGDDQLWGDNGNDRVLGGAGFDTLHGGAGNDDIVGGNDDDSLLGDGGHDLLRGGPGNDFLDGGTGNDQMIGGVGDDSMVGGSGNDTMLGNSGNDTISGGGGSDNLNGGSGTDSLLGGAAADTILGSQGDDELFGGTGNDYLNGGAGNDQLRGEGGDDDLYGSLDDDLLTGGAGLDLLHGGGGIDTATDAGERGYFQIELP
ncbi:calcium-binding protein [Planctomycetes bacterium K23_9]|uniref:Bifunctional hemolysin/adenylate cyclase n=1 Tax=Stieleria marina TaxID=1930275 RepID=A0A517NW43_9BACT|nr:Bifunctional hemolysin/adenylate cyclase precursor [Planctomycetes bacterium K23_9]